MFEKHQQSKNGDMSFMEDLLPKNLKAYHFDSYNSKEGRRFQGAFYWVFEDMEVRCNEPPLAILKIATRYQIRICNCMENSHISWTIWFD